MLGNTTMSDGSETTEEVTEEQVAPESTETKSKPKKKRTAKKTTTKKTPVKKATTKKATTKKKASKPKKEPKVKKEPKNKEKIDQSTKEVRWTSKKISILEAFKKAGAVNSSSAKTLEDISKSSGVKLSILTHQCNPKFDISVQEYIKRVVQEGSRKYCFHITKKGQNVKADK
jgi:outer membrane biosynthesis protein TonB